MTEADGLCFYTRERPYELSPDDRRSLELYFDTIALSGHDEHGFPKLDRIEFVIAARDWKMDSDALQSLLDRIMLIHRLHNSNILAKLKKS